jgi:hypothetical protein
MPLSTNFKTLGKLSTFKGDKCNKNRGETIPRGLVI